MNEINHKNLNVLVNFKIILIHNNYMLLKISFLFRYILFLEIIYMNSYFHLD